MKVLLALALIIFLGRTGEADSECGPPNPPCTRILEPVCAVRGRQFRTFPNRCVLSGEPCRKGWRFSYNGECIQHSS